MDGVLIMSLEKLLSAITDHYSDRGFPHSALEHLKAIVKRRYCQDDGTVVFRGDYTLQKNVKKLSDCFPRCNCAAPLKAQIANSDAIFAFSCGYRLRKYSDGGVEARLPGPNNRALGEIAVRLKSELQLPLYAQFEIADAIEDCTDSVADYRTPTEDMGTSKVIKFFVNHRMVQASKTFEKVIVVAHRHHIGRCLILLNEDFGIKGYPYGETYDGYDADECQRRAKCPNELIVSDFVSLASRAK